MPDRPLSDNEQAAMGLDAIKTVLAAYRSSEAHVTEAQITAAWAAYQEACELEAAVEAERDERLTLDESRTIAFRCTEAERERDAVLAALRDPSDNLREALKAIRRLAAKESHHAPLSGAFAREVADKADRALAARHDPLGGIEAALIELADHHHRTLTGSRLHDPEHIEDFRECPAQSCRAARAALAARQGEGELHVDRITTGIGGPPRLIARLKPDDPAIGAQERSGWATYVAISEPHTMADCPFAARQRESDA